MLGGQGGLVLAQGVALAAQLVALGVQLLQAGALRGKLLDGCVERVQARQQLRALRRQLVEFLVLGLIALRLVRGLGHLGAQVVLLGGQARDGVLDAGGLRGVFG